MVLIRAGGIELHAGHEAVGHVGAHAVVAVVRVALHGIVKVAHRGKRNRDRRRSEVVGV